MTTTPADTIRALYAALVREVRAIYKGPITYSANWDDVDQSVILGELQRGERATDAQPPRRG